jgi:hypothetical protein
MDVKGIRFASDREIPTTAMHITLISAHCNNAEIRPFNILCPKNISEIKPTL